VLATSLGPLPEIAPDLLAQSPRLAAMVANVRTTQTQALQLWFGRDTAALGWRRPGAVVGGLPLPFDTWADLSHLLDARETWPASAPARSLAYLCGALEDDEPPPPRGASAYTARQRARVRAGAQTWIEQHFALSWPGARRPDAPTRFDWDVLVDRDGRSGPARLDAQYWRATVNPSERYVLCVPGSVQHRLRAGESGFANLVLAGDFTRTAYSAGCAEAAVLSGLDAAGALCARTRPATAATTTAYVERAGEIVLAPPFKIAGTRAFAFLYPADGAKLAALCTRLFAAPSRGRVTYRPLLPLVAVVCADMARSCSTNPAFAAWGWSSEIDFGFWVPVVGGRRDEPERLAWLMPYVFVDNISTCLTGREVFGYPKQTADITVPRRDADPAALAVRALVIDEFRPTTEARVEQLVRVAREGATLGEIVQPWNDLEEALPALRHLLAALPVGDVVAAGPQLLEEMLHALLTRTVSMVFLKQVRDVADGGVPALQQIIEAPTRLDAWHGGGLLPPHQLSVRHTDSHRIVRTLGIASPTSIAAFHTRFDFTVEAGRVLWP
jgi:hypothetical protein